MLLHILAPCHKGLYHLAHKISLSFESVFWCQIHPFNVKKSHVSNRSKKIPKFHFAKYRKQGILHVRKIVTQ